MNRGPRFVVDHMAAYHLFGDPAFYRALPASLDAYADLCRAARERVIDAALGRGTGLCCGVGGEVLPALHALANALAAVQEAQPGALEPLAEAVAARKGYRPEAVVIYYKQGDGTVAALSF